MEVLAFEVEQHSCGPCHRDAGRGRGEGEGLSSFKVFFPFLSKKERKRKRNHLRDRTQDYCHLFWETMLVLLNSNQRGGEAMAAQGILESLWPSELSPGVGHNWARIVYQVSCCPAPLANCPRLSWLVLPSGAIPW